MSSSGEFHDKDYSSNYGTSQARLSKEEEKLAFSRRYSVSTNRLGLNDAEVGRRSGIPKNTISRWANGQSIPEAKYVFALADALQVNPRWLITGEGPREISDTISEDTSGEWQLVGLFRSLDQEARQHLLTTARILWERAVQNRMEQVQASPTVHSPARKFKGEDDGG